MSCGGAGGSRTRLDPSFAALLGYLIAFAPLSLPDHFRGLIGQDPTSPEFQEWAATQLAELLRRRRVPRDWWWALIVIKLATNAAVILYFLAASYSHIRARFLKQEFWVNCLGMLLLAVLALVFGFLV